MQSRTELALAFVAVIALAASVAVGATLFGFTDASTSAAAGTLTEQWVSNTRTDIAGNHHAPAAARIGGQGMVFAPVSGVEKGCALVALSGTNGTTRWRASIPPANCTIHSVADPTVADVDGDSTKEVLAATTERAVVVYDSRTGNEEARYDLAHYGYTRPIVADLTGNSKSEIIAVDVKGTVFVFGPNGATRWTKRLDSYVWGQPAVADFDGDGSAELAVPLATGELHLFEGNGTTRWTLSSAFDSSITWTTTGQADGDRAREIVVATDGGTVAAVDGRDGTIEWRHTVESFAAVHAFGDGDGDGEAEVYAVDRNGTLLSLDARDGSVEWKTDLTNAEVQMTPPSSMGDLDGDGTPELVVATNDGNVSVVDPTSGTVLATYQPSGEVPIYTHPTVVDTDGDGKDEIFVMYGDGRVVALSYHD